MPRQAAVIARNPTEGDFAESTISSYGFQVTRYESPNALKREMHDGDGLASATTPDIAILAGSSADFANGGKDAVAELADLVPVVVTSPSPTVAEAVEMMKHGAKDVVELPCGREEFWQRVSSTLEASSIEAACKARMMEMRARLDLLTPAENEVVDAMLDGLANKQIAQRLGIGLRTVELRRSKIMRKMQAKSVAELVKFICQSGKLRSQLVPLED